MDGLKIIFTKHHIEKIMIKLTREQRQGLWEGWRQVLKRNLWYGNSSGTVEAETEDWPGCGWVLRLKACVYVSSGKTLTLVIYYLPQACGCVCTNTCNTWNKVCVGGGGSFRSGGSPREETRHVLVMGLSKTHCSRVTETESFRRWRRRPQRQIRSFVSITASLPSQARSFPWTASHWTVYLPVVFYQGLHSLFQAELLDCGCNINSNWVIESRVL